MGETTAHRPLSDLTIQGFIVHSWYKHSHQVCVEVKMGQRCQQITHTLYCHKHHTLKRHSKCIVSVIENMLCTCIINFGPLLQFQVNSFTHGEIMTRFYVTLTMEQYFIMARSHVTLTLKAVKEILWCYGIQMKLLRPNFRTVRFINFLPKMYLNRVNLYPEKKICSQMPWERKLLSLPVLLKITYPVKQPQHCLYFLACCRRQVVESGTSHRAGIQEGGRWGGDLVPSFTTLPLPLRCGPCKLEPHPCIIATT